MKPLFVLCLVLVAVGVLFFAISNLDGGGSTPDTTISPTSPGGGATAAATTEPHEVMPTRGPDERAPITEVPDSGSEGRTGIEGDGFDNRLLGKVEGSGGEAVADAVVTLTRAGGMAMMFVNSIVDRSGDLRTKTDANGEFSFVNVEPYAHYTLEVDHADYSRAEVNEVNVRVQGESHEPPILLASGAKLTGHVRDANGVGIANATVNLDRMFFPTQGQPSPDRKTTVTDNLGFFEIRNVSQGNRALRVEAEGFGNAVVNGLSFRTEEEIQRDVTLEVAEMICGIVVGPGNTAIVGAEVIALSFSNSNQQCQEITQTGEDGRFCLEKLSPGKYTVAVRAKGYKASGSGGTRVDTGETNLVIEVQPQALVRGRVVDAETGQAVTAFQVTLRQTFEGHEQTSKTDTTQSVKHANGEFEISDVQPGGYLVEAAAPGYAPTFSERFRITQGQVMSGLVIRMGKGGAISGTVVGTDGAPVKGAVVETYGNDWTGSEFDRALGNMLPGNTTRRTARSDAAGNFTVTALKAETYQLRIQAAGHCEYIKTDIVVADNQNHKLGDVQLIQGGKVTGKVFDQAGKPVRSATVTIRVNGRTSGAARYYQGKSGGDGVYEFSNVFPGNYKILAAPPQNRDGGLDFMTSLGDSRSSEQPLVVTEGQTHTIELKLGG